MQNSTICGEPYNALMLLNLDIQKYIFSSKVKDASQTTDLSSFVCSAVLNVCARKYNSMI